MEDVARDPLSVEIEVGGASRRYVVWPARAEARPAPVLLLFHGWSSSPERVAAASDLPAKATAAGWTVVAPAGSGDPARWAIPGHIDGPDDIAFVEAVLADVGRRACVDTTRVAAVGFSNGAAFTARLSCALDLEAIALVSGANLQSGCAPRREATPVVISHGAADTVVRTDGGPVLSGRLVAEALDDTATRWRARTTNVTTVLVPRWGHTWPEGTTEAVLATFAV